MKSFKEFLSESINISGDFNGTLIVNDKDYQQIEEVQESFFADVVWEGKIYRMEIEGCLLTKNQLAEALQGEYPGAIVHNIYKIEETDNSLKIKNTKRYQPEKLTWTD